MLQLTLRANVCAIYTIVPARFSLPSLSLGVRGRAHALVSIWLGVSAKLDVVWCKCFVLL